MQVQPALNNACRSFIMSLHQRTQGKSFRVQYTRYLLAYETRKLFETVAKELQLPTPVASKILQRLFYGLLCS
jgi:hypothetical protein